MGKTRQGRRGNPLVVISRWYLFQVSHLAVMCRVTVWHQPRLAKALHLITTTTSFKMAGIYQSCQLSVRHSSIVIPLRMFITSPPPSTGISPVVSSALPLVLSKPRLSNRHKIDAADIFTTVLKAHQSAPPVQRPIIIRDVSPRGLSSDLWRTSLV